MKTNVMDLRGKSETALSLFIKCLMTKQEELGIADIAEVLPKHPDGSRDFDIVLTANGVELPFVEVLEELRCSVNELNDRDIERFIESRIGDRFRPIWDGVRQLEQTVKEQLQQAMWLTEGDAREPVPPADGLATWTGETKISGTVMPDDALVHIVRSLNERYGNVDCLLDDPNYASIFFRPATPDKDGRRPAILMVQMRKRHDRWHLVISDMGLALRNALEKAGVALL